MYLTNNNNGIFKQLLTVYAFYRGVEKKPEERRTEKEKINRMSIQATSIYVDMNAENFFYFALCKTSAFFYNLYSYNSSNMYLTNNNNGIFKQLLTLYAFLRGVEKN